MRAKRSLRPSPWWALAALLALGACSPTSGEDPVAPVEPVDCVPACEGRACGEDGCGGQCGACGEGESCSAAGRCEVSSPEGCAESCASAGAECGEVCGESCGECAGERSRCEGGRCVCPPDCAGKVCGDADGCGGVCAPCPREVACAECALVLRVVEREEVEGRLRAVTLAVDYQPGAQGAAPTIADLRLKVEGPAVLERVGLGEAMLEAQKELVQSPSTGRPYQALPEGVFQFLALSSRNTNEIPGGRWLFVRFLLGDTAQEGPAVFSLVKREQVLAPPGADSQLWAEAYDVPVVIWPEVRNER
jgi:hypothetical protein